MTESRKWSREQEAAIYVRGQNVLVSAGAGSGKTSVLVERVIQCIMGPNPVDLQRLLIVTFTEAAAAEMRHRIARRLQLLSEDAAIHDDYVLRRRISEQISQIELAQISTLHSFCMQVVRRNFLHLGLEPSFTLMGEDDTVLLQNQVLRDLLEDFFQVDHPMADRLKGAVTRLGAGQPDIFLSRVQRLYTFARSQAHPKQWLGAIRDAYQASFTASFPDLVWANQFNAFILRHLKTAQQSFARAIELTEGEEALTGYADVLRQQIELTGQAVDAMDKHAPLSTVVCILRAVHSIKLPRTSAHPLKDAVQSHRTDGNNIMKKLLPVLEREEQGLLDDIQRVAPDVDMLVTFTERFMDVFQAEKRKRGWLDFSDLEHDAFAALSHPASGEAEHLQQRFEEIFVDEYQDTSPIQDAIVAMLARPSGNVFVVGDVKQSIYRFRMAEPNLFLEKYRTLGHTVPGQVIDLSANYRSRKEVVHAVNFFFEQLFSDTFGGVVYDERTAMKVGASYPEGTPETLQGPVEVHLIEKKTSIELAPGTFEFGRPSTGDTATGSDSNSSDEVDDLDGIEKEAWVIGHQIRQLMGQTGEHERLQVWDAGVGDTRPLQYRDIVILMRSTKARMAPMLDVFREMGIPAYGSTSTGFYGALEVQWLLAALSALDNPRRDIEFATFLRSPFGGFTDEELALIRLLRKGTYYEAWKAATSASAERLQEVWPVSSDETEALRNKIRRFAAQFQQWRRLARRQGCSDVIRALVEDTGFLYYVAGMAAGDVRKGNVLAFIDRARQYDRRMADGVYGFVNFAQESLKHEVDLGEARTLGENEDVVRIMTIHQSKGLEFPVVFVASLGKLFFRSAEDKAFPLHRDFGFGAQRVDDQLDQRWPTIASIAVEESDLVEFLAEEARVLYVALTRAREKLILVASVRELNKVIDASLDTAIHTLSPVLPAHALLKAKCPLEWVLMALARHRSQTALVVLGLNGDTSKGINTGPLWNHPAEFSIHGWDGTGMPTVQSIRSRHVSAMAPVLNGAKTVDDVWGFLLDESRQVAQDVLPVAANQTVAAWQQWPGKVSATDLRRLWVAAYGSPTTSAPFKGSAERLLEPPSFARPNLETPRERGTAFHAVMQAIDMTTPPEAEAVQAAIHDVIREKKLSEEMAAAVSIEDVVDFLASPLGRRMAAGRRLLREQPFFHRLEVRSSAAEGAFVVVQGVMDSLVEEDTKWLLIDYKTDNIRAEHVATKAEEYAAQVAVYLEAAARVVGDKPVEAHLYFVKPRVSVRMEPMELSRLWDENRSPVQSVLPLD